MKLEFWMSPNHEVIVTNLETSFSQPLVPSHNCISVLHDLIAAKFPDAFERLNEKFKNESLVKFKIVRQFICCNFYINDSQPDYIDNNLLLENVPCPLKCFGCKDKNIICNPALSIFSKREKEVLELSKKGKSTQQIAKDLNVALDTVKNHKRNMMKKTNTHSIIELINY